MKFTDKVREARQKYLDTPIKGAMTVGIIALFIALIALTVALGNSHASK